MFLHLWGFSLHQLYEDMGLLLWGFWGGFGFVCSILARFGGFWLVWLVLGVLVGLRGFGFVWSILE
jgi:hypothetical protein